MNQVIQQLKERKSVRVFTDRPILPEEVTAILESAVNAPTAGNQQLYTVIHVTDPKLKDDTAPILVWGKYTEQNGKYIINMTLDVNHRFIDGYFVGQFVQKLEKKIAELNCAE